MSVKLEEAMLFVPCCLVCGHSIYDTYRPNPVFSHHWARKRCWGVNQRQHWYYAEQPCSGLLWVPTVTDLKGNNIALLAQFINIIEYSEQLKLGLNIEEWLQALSSVFSPFVIKLEVVSQDKSLVVVDWKARSCTAAYSGDTIIWQGWKLHILWQLSQVETTPLKDKWKFLDYFFH